MTLLAVIVLAAMIIVVNRLAPDGTVSALRGGGSRIR
jgi:hypothetical protein